MTLERAAKAGIWSSIELVARQGVSFVAVIFLARILTPADFGTFAFAILATMLAATLITSGFSAFIIKEKNLDRSDLDKIFTAVLLLSLIAGIGIAAAGALLAEIYELPSLAIIMPVIAIQPLIASAAMVQAALLNKELRLAPIVKVGWISNLVAGVGAVAAAFGGLGIWALVVHVLLAALINSILLWNSTDWRPHLRLDFQRLAAISRYAGPVSIAQAMHILYSQGFALIVGKRFSATDVGLFNRAYSVTQLPHQLFTGVVGRVALPLMAERADDDEAIVRGLKRGIEGVMIFSTPAFVGLALLSPDLLRLLYGEQWIGAAPVLTILALSGIVMPLQSANVHILLARGLMRTFFRLELQKKTLGIVLVGIASFYGIEFVAVAYLASNVIWLLFNTAYTAKHLGYGLWHQLWDVRFILVTASLMALIVIAFRAATDLPVFVDVIASAVLGAFTYFAVGLGCKLKPFIRLSSDWHNWRSSLR